MTDRNSSTALRILGTRGSLSELSSIDTTILKNGSTVYVTSARAYYSLDKTATNTEASPQIIAPGNGTGRWFMSQQILAPNAEVQNWYLDPVSGNDSNDGLTATTALKTRERVAQLLSDPLIVTNLSVVVHVLNDVPAGDPFFLDLRYYTSGAAGSFIIQGENPTTLFEGTLSSVVQENPATNVRASITINGIDWDTAGPGGTSLIGLRVRRLSDNSVAYLQKKDVSADTAFINRPSLGSGNVNWSATNVVRVEQLTSFGDGFHLHVDQDRAFLQVALQDLSISEISGQITISRISFTRCELDVVRIVASGATFFRGCHVDVPVLHSPGEDLFFGASWLDGVSVQAAEFISLDADNSITGRFSLNAGLVTADQIGIWDWPAGAGLDLTQASDVTVSGRIFGTSATAGTYGIRVRSGNFCQFSQTPVIAGVEAFDFEVGGVQDVYANLPAAGQDPGNNNAWLVTRA